MNIKQLQYFISIVENGTITAAAKKLGISQPPLSAQMKLLEEELGVELELDEKISTVGEMVKLVEEKMSEKE